MTSLHISENSTLPPAHPVNSMATVDIACLASWVTSSTWTGVIGLGRSPCGSVRTLCWGTWNMNQESPKPLCLSDREHKNLNCTAAMSVCGLGNRQNWSREGGRERRQNRHSEKRENSLSSYDALVPASETVPNASVCSWPCVFIINSPFCSSSLLWESVIYK